MTRVPLLTLLLSACASGILTPRDDGTDTPTDVGTASPCGEGAPEGCVRVGDTCMVSFIPAGVGTGGRTADEVIRMSLEGTASCGYVGATVCVDPRFFAFTLYDQATSLRDGVLVQREGGAVVVYMWDAQTGEQVAEGGFALPPPDGGCARWWFGAPDTYACLEETYQRAAQRVPSCTGDVTCDFCACRVNEVTDATSPGCVQP